MTLREYICEAQRTNDILAGIFYEQYSSVLWLFTEKVELKKSWKICGVAKIRHY